MAGEFQTVTPDIVQTPIDQTGLPGVLLEIATRHLPGAIRMQRHGDMEVAINYLSQKGLRSDHPDAYYVGGGKMPDLMGGEDIPHFLVIHSADGLQALGQNPNLVDKRPTSNIAIAESGVPEAYEAIMGMSSDPRYDDQIEKVDAIIKQKQKGLGKLVAERAAQHFSTDMEVGIREVQYFTASIILSDLYPAHDWTPEATKGFVDQMEHNAEIIGPAIQESALSGGDPQDVLKDERIPEVAASYEDMLSSLYAEEQAKLREIESADYDDESDRARDLERYTGVLSTLVAAEIPWSNVKPLAINTLTASYETVATSINEFLYQTATSPELWDQLKDPSSRRQNVEAAIYESVRIIDPLPFLMREAEDDTQLVIGDEGNQRVIDIQKGQKILGVTAAPLRNPAIFPEPGRMILTRPKEQKDVIRLAWGLQAADDSPADRFCKGFAYSIALQNATFNHLLDNFERPQVISDGGIEMYGTQRRKSFRAKLSKSA